MMMDSSRQQQLQYPWNWRPVNMSRRHVSKLQCHSHPVGGFSAETLQQASLESKACNSKQFLQLSLFSMSNLFILGWIARNLGQAFKLLYVSLFIAASSKFSVVLQVLLQRSFQLFLPAQTLWICILYLLQEVTGPLTWCYWDVRQVDAVSRYPSWPGEILEILTTTFQEYWPVHPPHFIYNCSRISNFYLFFLDWILFLLFFPIKLWKLLKSIKWFLQ